AAAEVALADEPAREALRTVHVLGRVPERRSELFALSRERDRERRLDALETLPLRGGREGSRLRRDRSEVRRIDGGGEHRLDPVVVRLEVGVVDRPPLADGTFGEPALVSPEHDVRVDERAAAEAARDQRAEAAKRPEVVQAVVAF